MMLRALLLALATVAAAPLPAADPPAEPILCLETGMHTGPIKHMSVDAAGRLLLTSSSDKTARLWATRTCPTRTCFRCRT